MSIDLNKLKALFGQQLKTDIALANFTKIGLGGLAKFLLLYNDEDKFEQARQTAIANQLPHVVLKLNDDILIAGNITDKLVICLATAAQDQTKSIKLFMSIDIDETIKKILITKDIISSVNTEKKLDPNIIFSALGLVNKKFGGLKQAPDNPNLAINTGEVSIDDVVVMTSYLKQQVRDKLGIQLRDNYQIISDN